MSYLSFMWRTLFLILLYLVLLIATAHCVEPAAVYGKIKFVESFPDVKVRVVTSNAALDVKCVTAFPNAPGKWQVVDSFPDWKVRMVTSGEDFTIRFVTAFPGPR